jgi:hypothetical protein
MVAFAYGEIITLRALAAVTSLVNILIFKNKAILNSSELFLYLLSTSVVERWLSFST